MSMSKERNQMKWNEPEWYHNEIKSPRIYWNYKGMKSNGMKLCRMVHSSLIPIHSSLIIFHFIPVHTRLVKISKDWNELFIPVFTSLY